MGKVDPESKGIDVLITAKGLEQTEQATRNSGISQDLQCSPDASAWASCEACETCILEGDSLCDGRILKRRTAPLTLAFYCILFSSQPRFLFWLLMSSSIILSVLFYVGIFSIDVIHIAYSGYSFCSANYFQIISISSPPQIHALYFSLSLENKEESKIK